MVGLALALALAAPAAQLGQLPQQAKELYRVAWERDLAGKTFMEWRPAETGGVAYSAAAKLVVAGTRDGWLHALREDGSVAWEFRGEGAFAGEPLLDGDTAYAGCNDGRLYALDLASGKERWRYETREQLGTRPAIADGLVYVASLQDTLYAVDARTGAWRWHHKRDTREGFTIFGAAAVSVAGGLVHAGFSDGTLVALDATTGAVRWERHAAPTGPYQDVDAVVVSEGRVFGAAYSGAVVALEAATGKPLWQREVTEPVQLAASSSVLIAVTTSTVQALSPVDGRVLWTEPLGGTATAVPRLAGRFVFVPAGMGGIRVIELATGRTLKAYRADVGVSAAPAISGRRAWVLTNSGRLLALVPK